jgi:hypothetical protein
MWTAERNDRPSVLEEDLEDKVFRDGISPAWEPDLSLALEAFEVGWELGGYSWSANET